MSDQMMLAMTSWWRRTSRAAKLVGYVGVITGAVASTAASWPYVEPYWYAHRGYVREYEAAQLDAIKDTLIKIQVRQNADRRQGLIDEAAKRETELQGEQAKKLPQYKSLVQDRVDRIKQELKTIDEEDGSLFKDKVGK